MEFIFFQERRTASIIPILTLIEHKPESIVGCILMGEDRPKEQPPDWFIFAESSENPASYLFKKAEQGEFLGALDVFLIVKEPGSLLQITVLVAIGCCNINHSGEAGRGGKTILSLLAKHNIRTYPAEVIRPVDNNDPNIDKLHQEAKKIFFKAFNKIGIYWLPEAWGLKPFRY
ncbi:MAG: hypothetical protein QNJ68_02270 [Microcoleaceae cyanobacterium MO_207.B10]|nr:hypothetical protein [Microcoleaceae cyanobacterium MO_207.B10]